MQQPPVDLKPYFLTLDDLEDVIIEGVIDWAALFGNDNPVEIDVGSGRGLFLVDAGLAHRDVNYLGIELEYREGRHAARRLKKREMPNVRVLGGDVRVAFQKYIPPHSVRAVHVYFPDPWWKRKHRRRRLFTDQLVQQIATVLQPGGLVHAWTDVAEYFEVIKALMDHHEQFQTRSVLNEREALHDLDYQTSFERKKRQAGCKIWRGLWQFCAGD